MVAFKKVYLAKELHSAEVVVEILEIPYWIAIRGRHIVETPIVAANSPSSARMLLGAGARGATRLSRDEEW